MARDPAQYLLTEALDLAELGRGLTPFGLAIEPGLGIDAERSFYDTFDGRLHAEGLSLVHESGRLALLYGGARQCAGAGSASDRDRFFASDLPPGALRELILPLVEVRALLRIARVNSRRRPIRVVDDDAKTVVRLVAEEPRLVGAMDGELGPRLYADAVRGYDKALDRVCRVLEGELGLVRADMSLQDEAVARVGGKPGGVPSGPGVELDREERADCAAATILRRQLEVIEANLPGTLANLDSEFLHDLRVGVRRTRSLQRELRRVFPTEPLAHFRTEFRWLQAATGPTRDLDVYVLEFDDFREALPEDRRADLEPLRKLLMQRRARERRRMVRALRSARAGRLLAEWAGFVAGLENAVETDRPDAARPIAEVAGGRISRVYRQMVKAGRAIDDSSPPEALHELRKKSKELRYLLEFFSGLYPGKVVKPMVRTLKALQDTLGRFQDREVQAELIRSLGDEVRALDDGAAALMAMGQLVERLQEQQAAARAEFAVRFAAFASPRQRALVRETFT